MWLDRTLVRFLGARWRVIYSNYYPREVISVHFFLMAAEIASDDDIDYNVERNL